MNKDKNPLVSIGMTIYNAKPFLEKAITSILAQRYENFELIISDNNSQDGSSDVCVQYARRDCRITYLHSAVNAGPNRSAWKVVDASSGSYYMGTSGHDIYDPLFLSRMLSEFDRHDESVILCYSYGKFIDKDDTIIGPLPDIIDTKGMSLREGFRNVLWRLTYCSMGYGLYRLMALRKAMIPLQVIGPDHVFLANLSLHGSIAFVNEPLVYLRNNRPNENYYDVIRRQTTWFCNNRYEALIPWTMHAYEHILIVKESELSSEEKEILFQDVRYCFTHKPSYIGPPLGDILRNEALNLITEGSSALQDRSIGPHGRTALAHEFARLAYICRYFSSIDYSAVLEKFISLCLTVCRSLDVTDPCVSAFQPGTPM